MTGSAQQRRARQRCLPRGGGPAGGGRLQAAVLSDRLPSEGGGQECDRRHAWKGGHLGRPWLAHVPCHPWWAGGTPGLPYRGERAA
eukprot:6246659-Alexandrium_andersonii.AAC.1